MEKIIFQKSKPFTLGVELEYQVIDQSSCDLTSRAPQIIKDVPERFSGKVAHEFLQSILEIQTGVCESVDDEEKDLGATAREMEKIAESFGCLLFASSLHPFSEPTAQKLTADKRYERIMEELQYVGRQFISQGLHVHVGMKDQETAIKICDTIQAYLPLLLSLSTSSPYFRGEDTGLYSYRTKLFEVLPLAGTAGFLGCWDMYEKEISLLKAGEVIKEIHDLWWDVRPSPYFGTVEVRICDLPSRFSEILALTAIIQALAVTIAEGGVQPVRMSPQLLRCNKWQAARHGLQGRFMDPLGFLSKTGITLHDAVIILLEKIQPVMERLNTVHRCDEIVSILKYGTSAHRQRQVFSETGTFRQMILQLQKEFWS